MRLAFLMPSNEQRDQIANAQRRIVEMRQDQIDHLEHLLRSWGIFGASNGIAETWRAIKRVLRDRP